MEDVAIIGGGPAGLMAAERLAGGGLAVTVYDRMPSLGRKLLMAGRGGLNLTHSEPFDAFLARYGSAAPHLEPALRAFPPDALRAWAETLGEPTFVGSSGRVFPKSFKASPLLRAWLRRLEGLGVVIRTRHTWQGWTDDGALAFETPGGPFTARPSRATVLAMGGASWPRLGSNGSFAPLLAARGTAIAPLRPANCGIRIAWSEPFRSRFAGQPLKRIRLHVGDEAANGEMVVTATGLEGGAVYALSRAIRDGLDADTPHLAVDLKPDLSVDAVATRLARPRRSETLSNFLRKTLALSPVQIGLLREAAGRDLPADLGLLAALVKSAPLAVSGVEGLERAISTAGGVSFEAVDADFQLRAHPGVYVAGEMMDWEAPTGGYLLQASFATGWAVAETIFAQ